ncbi:response regulator [Paenibacillus sp. GCM10012306]|uniref:response regulator n=1 Tax=Paenibacillus sp. GCM10012306 TaxID=3317342 RepID=UPI0036130A5E
MKLRLLIAEDEDTIREGIVNMIDWRSHQIEVVGEAGNGTEALALMENYPLDLLLTDIRMPQMNGLELIEAAQRKGYGFRSIILSGYNEFSYAKQAISLGVVDYVLKPCRPEEILKTVLKAKNAIETQRSQENVMFEKERSWHKNAPLVKSQVLSQWIHHPPVPLERREELLEELSMAIAPAGPQIGLVSFDIEPLSARGKGQDFVLLRYAALNIISETLGPIYKGRIETFHDGNRLLWIGSGIAAGDQRNVYLAPVNLKEAIGKLQDNLEKYLKLSISIAVGSCRRHLSEAHLSYIEANQAMESRFLNGKGGVYFYTEGNAGQSGPSAELVSILDDEGLNALEDEMLSAVTAGSYEVALDLLERWLDRFRSNPGSLKQEVNIRATALVVRLKRLTQEKQVAGFEWKQHLVNWMEQAPQVETLEELSAILNMVMQSVVEAFSNHRPLHRTVVTALEIIRQKYNTNLTLEYVAKEAYVSNTYLSSLFRQELGVNFLDYLHQYRVEEAKKLLRQNLKMYAVAKLVGYGEERHFSATFKKWTGLTPSQYQKGLEK